MQVDFLSVVILVTIAQALFLIFSLATIKSASKQATVFLLISILTLIWYQSEFFAVRNKIEFTFSQFYGTRYGAWLLLGPLIWLYTRSSLESFQLTWRSILHFIPFLVFWLIIPLLNDSLLTWRSVDYGMLTVFDSWNQNPITVPQYVYGSIFLIQFFHVGIYSVLSFRYIRDFEGRIKSQLSNFDDRFIQWQKIFHVGIVLIVVLTAAFILYQFQTRIYRRNADYFYVMPVSGIVFFLMYQALRIPNLIFKLEEKREVKERYGKSSLSESASKVYLEKLKEAIESENLYLNRELRLSDLADHLGMSTHHLSQVINENLQQNFFDFINQYRVTEAKKRISDEENKSLLQIAYEVGFNNKTSFTNAFKRHVGMTPSQFRQSA